MCSHIETSYPLSSIRYFSLVPATRDSTIGTSIHFPTPRGFPEGGESVWANPYPLLSGRWTFIGIWGAENLRSLFRDPSCSGPPSPYHVYVVGCDNVRRGHRRGPMDKSVTGYLDRAGTRGFNREWTTTDTNYLYRIERTDRLGRRHSILDTYVL